MKGQMMQYALTTHSIIEYGNRVFPLKEIITKLPDGQCFRYSYSEMYKRTKRLAAALIKKLGVSAGDRVATLAWNHYQHLELYYAIPGAGAVCHTLNIRLSSKQIVYIINHAEDKVLFLDASLVSSFEKIAPEIPLLKKYIIMNAPTGFVTSLPGVIYYEDLLSDMPDRFEWVEVDENDACGLCYTSGTTGDPKGVLYSHRTTYLHAMAIMQPNGFNISSKDRALLIVPQFHVMAWGFPFVCMLAGADIVLPSCHLQPEALIDIIQKERVSVANGVPSIWMGIYEALKKNPPLRKLPLKEFFVGGSAFPLVLIAGFERDFGIPGIHAWGMTETSPLGTISRLQPHHDKLPSEEQLIIRSKQGIELPGVELRAVAANGGVVPRDGITEGEFEIRGAWITNGYFGFPEDRSCFSADGWFKTGDVGTIDVDGYMMITDRKKDLIKSGGEWISSIALELALMAHPKIKEACVVAIPDKRWTERPLACIVFTDGETVPASDLNHFLSKDFKNYQLPDRYVTLKEIPKTSVGKLDKKELRRLFSK